MTPNCGEECQEALAELEAYLDGELDEGELERVRSHLSSCYPCADRASFEEHLRALLRERCAESAPPTLIDKIRDRLTELETTGR